MIIYDPIEINIISADMIKNTRVITVNYKRYKRLCAGYDSETTRIEKRSYIYHFAISFGKYVFGFNRWEHFIEFIEHINHEMHRYYRQNKNKPILIIWVANLSFEFQFLKDRFKWDKIFAINARQPLAVDYKYIQFREALKISGSNLAHLAKTFCKTQKMIGDLDYTKIRSFNDVWRLSDKEKQYIENDVVILSEFADYIYKNCLEWGTIPYTATGLLRQECKKEIAKDKVYKKYIQDSYFDEAEYKVYMHYLFRGGYTHANRIYTNMILYDVESWDKKSSYPSKILQQYFPYGKFTECAFKEELTDKYCCIMDVYFFDIKNTTTHSIESKHKIIEAINAKYDNGRLLSASMIHVLITELDYDIYKKFYKWKNKRVVKCQITQRKPLPEFLRRLTLKYFTLKEITPKGTIDYFISKQKVNAFYGMTVTRLHFLEHIYNGDYWTVEKAKDSKGNVKTWNDFLKTEFLLPSWGIWITAHARYDILSEIFKQWRYVVYCDTDSIYFVKGYNKKLIEEKNAELTEINKNGDQANFPKLGCYEFEGRYKRFKTLGAKKYIKEYYRKFQKQHKYKITDRRKAGRQNIHRSYYCALHLTSQTIAGLGKNALTEYCNKKRLDIFDVFTPKMLLLETWAQKLITHYEDKPHSDIINGVEMSELSSVSLVPSDFAVHVDNEFLILLIKTRGLNYGH